MSDCASELAEGPRVGWPERGRWRDLASGTEYVEPGGAPLLSAPDAVRNVVGFFILDGRLHFLARTDVDLATTVVHGTGVRSGQVVDGRVVWQ